MDSKIYILVSGRWDNDVAVVSLDAALDPANRGTPRAVVSRPRVTPDVLVSGAKVRACGLPVSIAVAPHLGRVFVVNHTGAVTPDAAARMPHGHPGTVAVLDLVEALSPVNDGGLGAIVATVPVGAGGPVGCALTPDGRHLLVTSGEGDGTEDGGHVIAAMDTGTCEIPRHHALRHKGLPSKRPSPHPRFGGFPNPNGIAVTQAHGGLVFTANGGTDDVMIAQLADVLAEKPGGDAIRIPVGCGPFGLDVSADGSLLAVANREDARTGAEGHSVTIIGVEAALDSPQDGVIAHVPVGGSSASRPMTVAFSPDGLALFVVCFRTGTLSRIDVAEVVSGGGRERPCVKLESTDGRPACPRGVHVTSDGRLVLVAGGARGESGSSQLWIFDAATLANVGHVTNVGNESYLLTSVAISPTLAEAKGVYLSP